MYAIEKGEYHLIEKMLALFDRPKLRSVIISQTFAGRNCLHIAEEQLTHFPPLQRNQLWNLLHGASLRLS